MGYSLLLGVHDVSQGLEEGNTADGDPDLDDDEEYDSAGMHSTFLVPVLVYS